MSNTIKPILNNAMTHTIRIHSNDVEPFFLPKESAPITTTFLCSFQNFD